ncbi:MAG TPA: 16S rRNA (adenine(1518)-N(6)/adenine(1519)-N(6))-dimethyltransferase RsmA [Terriglobales bacterium]|jgi:16S rRNA (adenine1518-N6/adenine1519-N6)-dimethyltransferase|nr:16S rRNA (adenine(1518)-N(6)/adenine(1519)-N(6))-dimethyltransferase RsmA [Terriglobales bacterium]
MANKIRVNVHSKPTGGKKAPVGQNFLNDPAAARKIVDALGNIRAATVIEVGPGRGVLTDLLARTAGRLIAIELDRVLAAQLRMKYSLQSNVEIIEGDVLTVDFANVIRRKPGPLLNQGPQARADETLARARIIGNLPYYITSDILLHLFRFHTYLETIVIMVQQEVAERIAAKPGSRDYGLLSATAQLYARVEKLFTLPPGAFSPAPKVHSTVLRMTVSPQLAALRVEEAPFIDFLKLIFAQKRKTLFNNLRDRYDNGAVREALQEAKIRPDVRAEALDLKKTAEVFRRLTQ